MSWNSRPEKTSSPHSARFEFPNATCQLNVFMAVVSPPILVGVANVEHLRSAEGQMPKDYSIIFPEKDAMMALKKIFSTKSAAYK